MQRRNVAIGTIQCNNFITQDIEPLKRRGSTDLVSKMQDTFTKNSEFIAKTNITTVNIQPESAKLIPMSFYKIVIMRKSDIIDNKNNGEEKSKNNFHLTRSLSSQSIAQQEIYNLEDSTKRIQSSPESSSIEKQKINNCIENEEKCNDLQEIKSNEKSLHQQQKEKEITIALGDKFLYLDQLKLVSGKYKSIFFIILYFIL